MPYGKGKGSHKGRARKFTSVDELKSQQADENKWRSKKQDDSDDSSDESSSDEEGVKGEPVIAVQNPNHVVNKVKKISQLGDLDQAKPELSRREKEEIQKQEATRRYQALHAQGKTDEARADLARLAIIRKEREAAAERRKLEKQEAEDRQRASKEASLNAIKSGGRAGGRTRRKK